MKLSDIKGDRAIEVIADIIEPISNISGDAKFKELLSKEEVKGKAVTFLSKVKKHVPYLLKTHTKDLFTVFASLEGISYEEYYKSVNLAKLMASIFDLLNDTELQSLFTSAEQVTETVMEEK